MLDGNSLNGDAKTKPPAHSDSQRLTNVAPRLRCRNALAEGHCPGGIRRSMSTPTEYEGETLHYRVFGNVLLCFHRAPPSDEDWGQTLEAVKEAQGTTGVARIVAVALREQDAPSTAQRTRATSLLDTSRVKLATIGPGVFLRVVLKAFSLFLPNARIFAPGEYRQALEFVGADDVAGAVRALERMLESRSESA